MRTERGRRPRFLLFGGGALLVAAVRWLLGHVTAVEVRGGSMAPGLLPGDWLFAERLSYVFRAPHVGEVVVAADPRERERDLVKRVTAVEAGLVTVHGDHPEASTDSREFGPIPTSLVRGRVWLRYWPPSRMGIVGRRRPASSPGGEG
ncbi:MAG TPA: nickel-type superoxide dismutase maturation protease [Candidatus Limnocylindria bacterium]|nr:nickel-type superoxide dismutase maturation protease [Candidatus Limnocylindria bacterium]